MAAVAVLVAALVFVTARGDGGSAGTSGLAQQVEASARTAAALEHNGFTLGAAGAPVELEVFEDFQCPFCVKFTALSEPVIVEEYVKAGKVRLTFRNFPILGQESVAAAKANVCAANQDRAWPYLLGLFAIEAKAGQAENERLNVGRFGRDALVKVATGLGMDGTAFASCLDGSEAGATVREQAARGTALGVRGTPGFAINGTLLANVPADAAGWRRLLDAAVAAATPAAR